MAAKAYCAQDCATNRLSMQKIIPQPPARRNAQQRSTGKLCGDETHLIAGQLHGGCNLRERFAENVTRRAAFSMVAAGLPPHDVFARAFLNAPDNTTHFLCGSHCF
ncbi:hypothetical protein DDIC_02405 [Desulfovibrio desulfuricans]|uniref:Uncharacterized protein n=1 Tax=Desulfovibrio desulfuricans TaxID=876 RepID=A0A4P7UH20_DESDE|nr:hypothetical protein [Desulfovibrio desulfuricans]QCC84747.1 hypothetical protein DDIC_02405 [Desulfovibrio desulfuricans]